MTDITFRPGLRSNVLCTNDDVVAGIDTDCLIAGAGAAGMAFADALIADRDADVMLVDRRDCPGGHRNDAYAFARLHQPSAFYGVNSRMLGGDPIDTAGPNAGLYERATPPQLCGYYQRVLDEHLLASGRVRFFGMCHCLSSGLGERHFLSRLTGEIPRCGCRAGSWMPGTWRPRSRRPTPPRSGPSQGRG